MPKMGGVKGTQNKVGDVTTSIKNEDGEYIPWDMIQEACDVPVGRKDLGNFLTVREAGRKWKLDYQAIYAKARRNHWRMVDHYKKQRTLAKEGKIDWGKRADKHREVVFDIAHESVKRFKARAPKNFREFDIADKAARRAAGLENDSIVQQTLVHVNEAIEDHADSQVIEADIIEPSDQAIALESAGDDHNTDTSQSSSATAP